MPTLHQAASEISLCMLLVLETVTEEGVKILIVEVESDEVEKEVDDAKEETTKKAWGRQRRI